MRKLCAIVLLAAIAVGCQQTKQPNTTVLGLGTPYIFANEFMIGKVKQVKETLYWAKEENGQAAKGDLISWKQLDSLNFSHSFIANFNEAGQIIGFEYFDEKNKVINSWNGLVENGLLVRASNYLQDSVTYYIKNKYDEAGNLVETSFFNPINDTLYGKWVVTNDNNSLYTKIEYYNYKNDFKGKNVFSRNEIGRIIKREFYNRNDSITSYDILTYNDKNVFDSQEMFSKGNNIGKWNFDYTFGKDGNWSTVICSKNDKPILFVERNYVYY